MSKITEINQLPKNVESWGRCLLLHKKRPVYSGKKIWIESIQEWGQEIIWVCDQCTKEKKKLFTGAFFNA